MEKKCKLYLSESNLEKRKQKGKGPYFYYNSLICCSFLRQLTHRPCPPGQRPAYFKCALKLTGRLSFSERPETFEGPSGLGHHDATGFVQQERAARSAGCSGSGQPAGREERICNAAHGSPLHVLGHHPAASVHAPAA